MRIEKDVLGKVKVPDKARYGSFTVRANTNFQISPYKVHPTLIQSHTLVKKAAAIVNHNLGYLSSQQKNAIIKACDEIIKGKHHDQFSLDVFQAGAGTPINMNVNEVIANRANQILGGKLGTYDKIHPNNHVNMAQSTNDTVPTSTRITTLLLLEDLCSSLEKLENSFRKKAKQYKNILKTGRTHHEDAVPITVGQELLSFADTLKEANERVQKAKNSLFDLGIGGTAVGTGITTDPKYQSMMVKELKRLTKYPFASAKNLLQKSQSMDCFAEVSSALRILAQDTFKICEDLCFLNSGPQAGIAEYILPEVEPGSSIMPGKINPSIPEAMQMVCFEVIGNDHTIQLGVMHSVLQLNVHTPLIGFKLFESIELLTKGCDTFRKYGVDGLIVNKKRCEELLHKSTATATALNPYLGYQVMSSLVHEALKRDMRIKDVILEKKLIDKKDIDRILSPAAMTKPNKINKKLVEKIKKSKNYQEFLKKI
ncbi:aspartate ammonia-lyase [Candidatus Woesearchaeota archaeon]|nr:aspartate ammonia-lyase [Candidatus Woesearchaeota archaeon]